MRDEDEGARRSGEVTGHDGGTPDGPPAEGPPTAGKVSGDPAGPPERGGPPAPPEEELGITQRARAAVPVVARKGALAVALGWFGLTTVFPFWLGIWFLAVFATTVGVAEGLEETDGLVETTFGAGYVIGLVTLAALVLGLFGLRHVGSEETAKVRRLVGMPFLVPAVLFTVAAVGSFVLEEEGTDLPDVLTTAAFLGVWDLVLLLLPIWLAVMAWKAASGLQSWAGAGPYRAGLATGLLTAGGLLFPIYSLHGDPIDDDSVETQWAEDVLGALDMPEPDGWMDGTHQLFQRVAVVEGLEERYERRTRASIAALDEPFRLLPTRTPFEECAEELAEPQAGSRFSHRDTAIGRLINNGHRREDAEDVTHLTIILVCEKYADGSVREYVPYFFRSVGNNAKRRFTRERLVACDPSDFDEVSIWTLPAGGSEYYDVERAFCRLTAEERQLVLLGAQGWTGQELADEYGISAASARQRLSRARSSLREAL